VEIALQTPSLLVLRGDEPLPRCSEVHEPSLELGGEPNVPKHEPGLRREIGQELLLRRRDRLVRWFGQRKSPEELGLMTHRDRSIGLGERGELTLRDGKRCLLGLRALGPGGGELKLVADPQPYLGPRCSRSLSEDPGHPGQDVNL
jgi:hypothetical protein